MILASISHTTKVYKIISKCEIVHHLVDHAELADVSYSLRALTHASRVEAEEDYWQKSLDPVRRLAFALCSTPLPFNRAAAVSGIDWDKLNQQVRLSQHLYPDSYDSFSGLVQKMKSLSEEACSPFTIPLESLHSENGGMSVIIHNPRMNQAVAAYFAGSAGLSKARVVSARQLREAHMHELLVTIGPCRWFPDHVFLAPRAQRIHVISFRWLSDLWKPEPVFLNCSESTEDASHKHSIGELPKIRSQPAISSPGLPNLEPKDLLPPIRYFKADSIRLQPDEETVPAKICLLSGGRAVFVSAGEGASQLIIDPSETGGAILRRVPTDALEADLCLLLRTSGGGDYIAPLADRILGNLAEERRKQQAEWKNRLLDSALKQFGALSRRDFAIQISNKLRLPGLSKMRPANIHYWMSSKCIHPSRIEDFSAILDFAGIKDRTQELWKAMEEIDCAHRRAGHVIRKMLLQQISTASLEPLERDGEMTFDLGEQDGGSLSAFQITQVFKEVAEIPVGRIGVLLDLENSQWLA